MSYLLRLPAARGCCQHKYLGFDKILSRDIFLVVPAIEDASKEESAAKENDVTHSFSYLLNRRKDEK
jgi:hypothetical protein